MTDARAQAEHVTAVASLHDTLGPQWTREVEDLITGAIVASVAAALQEQQGEHYFSVVCEECGHVTNTEVPCQSPPNAPVSDEALAAIECDCPTDPIASPHPPRYERIQAHYDFCVKHPRWRAALAGGQGGKRER